MSIAQISIYEWNAQKDLKKMITDDYQIKTNNIFIETKLL